MLKTKYGELRGIVSANYYENGQLKDCILDEKNVLETPCGALIPQYGEAHFRRKYIKSLAFYDSGELKSISLEEQSEVMTPMGEFPAELITFYKSGEVRRVFPLNGKISGYWSEANEAELAVPFHFEFDFGGFAAKIIGLHFYLSGTLKSLTLFPQEVVTLRTPAGEIPVRTGFSLYESGALKSVEPAEPILLMTAIGVFTVFDCNAVGIHADSNSLGFYENGEIHWLASSSDKIVVTQEDGKTLFFAPVKTAGPPDEDQTTVIPLRIAFEGERIVITDEKPHVFNAATTRFYVLADAQPPMRCSPADCASCGGGCGR